MVNGSEGMEFKATIQFSGANFGIAFLMAVILCLVSSIIPILKVSKIPIKDIVLNSMQKNSKRRRVAKFSIISGELTPSLETGTATF